MADTSESHTIGRTSDGGSLEIKPLSQLLRDPSCHGMQEIPTASGERAKVTKYLGISSPNDDLNEQDPEGDSTEARVASVVNNHLDPTSPLFHHLSHGLALTVGSALGSTPPSISSCFTAFLVPNKALLTAGARAWSKHAHRSKPSPAADTAEKTSRQESDGWWGTPSGPVATINERALVLFWKIMNAATWRNLHWLPHRVLVYEIRVFEGYGMRWSQDQSANDNSNGDEESLSVEKPWIFRGFVEPMMENGHEVGWRHPS